jgi:hypothetical protein
MVTQIIFVTFYEASFPQPALLHSAQANISINGDLQSLKQRSWL